MLALTKRRAFGAVLFCLASLIVGAWALGWIPAYVEICEETEKAKHCASYNIFFYSTWQAVKFLDRYSVLITAIATGTIGYFTYTLKASTDRLWDAGEKQRKLSEDTAKRQLRAYVHVEDVKIEDANNLYSPIIHVIIKNYGSTPARRITNTCVCDTIFIRDEKNFRLDNAIAGEVADLAPSQTVHSMFPYSMQKWINERQRISSKSTIFYVFGRIDYRCFQ
jgi:hypothetical protein